MRRTCIVIIMLLLGACSISPESIRPDGTLVVELTGYQTFRVGKNNYTTSSLEVALKSLRKSTAFKRVELNIPSKILRKKGFSCQDYALAFGAAHREWRFFEWTPGHPETRVPTTCDYAVLAHFMQELTFHSSRRANARGSIQVLGVT